MSRSMRFSVEPRDVPPDKAARRLGLPLERFTELLPQLLRRGFPPSDPDTGNFDLDAIDAWRSARHRKFLQSVQPQEQSGGLVAARLEAMRG